MAGVLETPATRSLQDTLRQGANLCAIATHPTLLAHEQRQLQDPEWVAERPHPEHFDSGTSSWTTPSETVIIGDATSHATPLETVTRPAFLDNHQTDEGEGTHRVCNQMRTTPTPTATPGKAPPLRMQQFMSARSTPAHTPTTTPCLVKSVPKAPPTALEIQTYMRDAPATPLGTGIAAMPKAPPLTCRTTGSRRRTTRTLT